MPTITSPELTEQPEGVPPVALTEETIEKDRRLGPLKIATWAVIALLGGVAWVMIALVRGETVNGIWFVFAAVCSYFIANRFYANVIERYLTKPDDRRATPGEYRLDGSDGCGAFGGA